MLTLKLRGRTLALAIGGALAIGLPAGLVLAAADKDAHGDAVAAAARSTSAVGEAHGDAVSTVARGSHGTSQRAQGTAPTSTTDPDETATGTTPTTDADAHGDAVSTVARDLSMVGGKNDNHGGAVSAVARGNAPHGAGPVGPTAQGAPVAAAARDGATTGEAHGDAVSTVATGH